MLSCLIPEIGPSYILWYNKQCRSHQTIDKNFPVDFLEDSKHGYGMTGAMRQKNAMQNSCYQWVMGQNCPPPNLPATWVDLTALALPQIHITLVNSSSSWLQSSSSFSSYYTPRLEYLLYVHMCIWHPSDKFTIAPTASSPAKGHTLLFVLFFFIRWGHAHWCMVAFNWVRCCTPCLKHPTSCPLVCPLTSPPLSQHHLTGNGEPFA